MYLMLAIVLTALVILLAWRGVGMRGPEGDADRRPAPPPRPRPRPSRPVAPDDDPDFLREIDRRLHRDDKSGQGEDKV